MSIELEVGLFGTTTLGALTETLSRRDPDEEVFFDFAHFIPSGIDSYRGFYDRLAIGYGEPNHYRTVAGLVADLRKANGAVFTGYKGGEYKMVSSTPIWVANRGESWSTAIVGIADCSWATIIRTAWVSI